MKIGIDVHGVIDSAPEVFSRLTRILSIQGHEIHIITGGELCDELLQKLDTLEITYHKVFSITSYHKKIGTHMVFKNGDPSHPMIAPTKWDPTKAEYCDKEGIDIHIDDSEVYKRYFEKNCQYILFSPAIKEFLLTLLSH